MKASSLIIGTISVALAGAGLFVESASAAKCGDVNVRCRSNSTPVCVEDSWICTPEGKGSSAPCLATCPDGHEYPTCDHLGRELFIYGDPCKNHDAFPSTNSCDGPSKLSCQRGTTPTCVKNEWTCAAASSSSSGGAVVLTSLTPRKTLSGKKVLIEGKGFAPRNNIVIFADSVIPGLGSTDGKHVSFRVPAHTVRPCYLTKEAPCNAPTRTYTEGSYAVSVKVGRDTSNALTIVLSAH